MARRVYIVAKDTAINAAVLAAAAAQNCPEIAQGIPPALAGIINPASLPTVYIEPEPGPQQPSPIEIQLASLKADVETLKTKVADLETKLPK